MTQTPLAQRRAREALQAARQAAADRRARQRRDKRAPHPDPYDNQPRQCGVSF